MSNQNAETKQELAVIDQQNLPVPANFQTEKGLDTVVEEIRQRVKAEPFDISTKSGRTKMRSFARFGIGGSKTMLVDMSDKLRANWKSQDEAVRKETKSMKEAVDAIRDDFLAPLIEFENKEKDRLAKHETNLAEIRCLSVFEIELTVEQINDRLEQISVYGQLDFEEFVDKKDGAVAYAEKVLTEKIAALKEQEVKDEELAQLKKEKEEREQKEHDEKIAKDAEEAATYAAEESAMEDAIIEKEKTDAETKRLKDIADQAEKDKATAEKLAEESAEAERQKISDEKQAEVEAAKKREDDQAHNAKINKEILAAFYNEMSLDEIEDSLLKQFLNLIRQGKIPHVKISY